MATSAATLDKHLGPRPGSNDRQLFLKGRRTRAAVVPEAVHGPDPYKPEEFSRDYGVPWKRSARPSITWRTTGR